MGILIGVIGTREPIELNMRGNFCMRGNHFLDIESEAYTALGELRQLGHHADHLNIPALPCFRQGIR